MVELPELGQFDERHATRQREISLVVVRCLPIKEELPVPRRFELLPDPRLVGLCERPCGVKRAMAPDNDVSTLVADEGTVRIAFGRRKAKVSTGR